MSKSYSFSLNLTTEKLTSTLGVYFWKGRIPKPLIFAFTVIRYEMETYLIFSAKGYRNILFGRVGARHPRFIYVSGGKFFFLINSLKVNVQQKILICGRMDNHRAVLLSGLVSYDTVNLITTPPSFVT